MLALTIPAASFIREPPAGYAPPGYAPGAPAAKKSAAAQPTPTSAQAAKGAAKGAASAGQLLRSRQFVFMWILFFMNITAGIMFIGFQSPMIQDLLLKQNPGLGALEAAAAGATLIALSSVCNGLGRFLWGGISDRIGRHATFRIILGTQFLVFLSLSFVANPWIFGLLVCYVLLCYGGGFGTMPSFVTNMFGPKMMPTMYGIILTAWSTAGIVGPQIVAVMKDTVPEKAAAYTFMFGALFLAIGFVATFLVGEKPAVQES